MIVEVDIEKKELTVNQELTFFNQTNDTLTNIVLNDWMNGYTSKNTPLAARFSDEFERGFHLAKENEEKLHDHLKQNGYHVYKYSNSDTIATKFKLNIN
jgi:hypothetical protein